MINEDLVEVLSNIPSATHAIQQYTNICSLNDPRRLFTSERLVALRRQPGHTELPSFEVTDGHFVEIESVTCTSWVRLGMPEQSPTIMIGTLTADLLAQHDELGDCDLVTADAPVRRPLAIILDSAGNYGCQVADGSKGDDWVMICNNNGAAVLEIEGCLQGRDMRGCLVRGREIVEEEPWLEKRIFEDLWEASVVRGACWQSASCEGLANARWGRGPFRAG